MDQFDADDLMTNTTNGVHDYKRIRSAPGKSVLPVSSSAMMHPTDHMSTVR